MDLDADAPTKRELKPDIFRFRDYRQYILAVIAERKLRAKRYKRLDFARAIGFASDSGLNMVLTGQRELRPPYLDKCIRNLKLSPRERLYFEAMVRAASMSPGTRRNLLREVEMLSSTWEAPAGTDGIRLVDFFIAQQVLCLRQGFISPAEIRESFRYPISANDVRTILEWMKSRGYVEENEFRFRILKSVMTEKDEVPDASLRQVHIDAARLAEQALISDPIEAREFQTYYFTVDSRRLPDMKQKIKKLVLDVVSEFETEVDADAAMQMHFNLIEVTRRQSLSELSTLAPANVHVPSKEKGNT